jgi:hypothetical protein
MSPGTDPFKQFSEATGGDGRGDTWRSKIGEFYAEFQLVVRAVHMPVTKHSHKPFPFSKWGVKFQLISLTRNFVSAQRLPWGIGLLLWNDTAKSGRL